MCMLKFEFRFTCLSGFVTLHYWTSLDLIQLSCLGSCSSVGRALKCTYNTQGSLVFLCKLFALLSQSMTMHTLFHRRRSSRQGPWPRQFQKDTHFKTSEGSSYMYCTMYMYVQDWREASLLLWCKTCTTLIYLKCMCNRPVKTFVTLYHSDYFHYLLMF